MIVHGDNYNLLRRDTEAKRQTDTKYGRIDKKNNNSNLLYQFDCLYTKLHLLNDYLFKNWFKVLIGNDYQ